MVLFLAGIASAYSLDRLLDRPADGYPRWLWLALAATFMTSALAGLLAIVYLPIQTIAAVIVFAAASLLYRRLKRYPMAKTILVAMVWTWAGAALPISSHHWAAWDWWSLSVSWPLVLLLSAGCILCDLKDAEADRRLGVRSLPVVLGMSGAIVIASALALSGAALAWTEGRMGLFYSGALLLAVTQFRPVLSRPAIGPLLVDAILSLPGFLILARMI
jgi:4-hydroxybenzoate polyprenyltransferase